MSEWMVWGLWCVTLVPVAALGLVLVYAAAQVVIIHIRRTMHKALTNASADACETVCPKIRDGDL